MKDVPYLLLSVVARFSEFTGSLSICSKVSCSRTHQLLARLSGIICSIRAGVVIELSVGSISPFFCKKE